jgi:hypothetical protein
VSAANTPFFIFVKILSVSRTKLSRLLCCDVLLCIGFVNHLAALRSAATTPALSVWESFHEATPQRISCCSLSMANAASEVLDATFCIAPKAHQLQA